MQFIKKVPDRKVIMLSILSVICASIHNNLVAQPKESGYAPVNGLKLYYEIYGDGEPLVLLHGAYMTINMNWGQLIPEFSKTRKVIAVEMQGHGRTADIDRPFSYEALADDIAKLLKHLNIDSADVIGYSLGGTVALQLGITHPELVRKMVIVSTVYKYEGWLPEVRDQLKSFTPDFFDSTPLKTEYEKIAPNPEYWRKFVKKLLHFDTQDFDLGKENIKSIKSPALFIMGDNDGVDLNHVADMYKLCGGNVFGDIAGLPKSQLAILPGMTHVSLMMATNQLMSIINPFLDKTKGE